MKVPCYLNPTGSNYYAKPIEGLFAVVDLMRGEATAVVDEGVVPVPEDDWGYTPDEVAARQPLRPASNPVDLTQAGSPGYAITGSRIEWDILALPPARRQAPGHRALEHRRARRRAPGVRCSTRRISRRSSCPTWTRPRVGTSAPTWTAANTASACSSAR